eukprot:TRINITY_DN1910_c0_g1_i1.p2 TRINITY_DN1910_c0_g1~~TRINITY_DN1910_c0_g1_i1.p2  ORF type:complete len:138 (+),score=28.39 TRINITY_DN1910_c0_g1_i1:32-415(+)
MDASTWDLEIADLTEVFARIGMKPSFVPLPLPFPGAEGEWVLRKECPTQKSFGAYCCSACSKRWLSSRAQKKYKQACKACNTYCLPTHMWKNTHRRPLRPPEKVLEDKNKPHMSSLCEACQRGSCTR